MKQDIRFETVEEMAAWIVSNHYRNDVRWSLESNTRTEWDDPVAGEKWLEERNAIPWVSYGDPEHAEYESKMDELETRRPGDHQVEIWSLQHSSSGSYRSEYIELSVELGHLLDGIWTKKLPYPSASYKVNTNSLTIPGMLKRLGKTDIGNQVKAAQNKAEEDRERNHRNYARKQIREHAQAIIALMDKNPGIVVPTSLFEIVNEQAFVNEE